jgi:hypothetical protein
VMSVPEELALACVGATAIGLLIVVPFLARLDGTAPALAASRQAPVPARRMGGSRA